MLAGSSLRGVSVRILEHLRPMRHGVEGIGVLARTALGATLGDRRRYLGPVIGAAANPRFDSAVKRATMISAMQLVLLYISCDRGR
jgi:hypothetical protein